MIANNIGELVRPKRGAAYDAKLRRKADQMAKVGMSPRKIAAELNIPAQTVRKWVRYNWQKWKELNRPTATEIRWANDYYKKNGVSEWLADLQNI